MVRFLRDFLKKAGELTISYREARKSTPQPNRVYTFDGQRFVYEEGIPFDSSYRGGDPGARPNLFSASLVGVGQAARLSLSTTANTPFGANGVSWVWADALPLPIPGQP